MNGLDYQQWMCRAFLNVEAVLSAERCAETSYLNEEYVRTALVKGLVMARPAEADRVTTEADAVWSASNCVNCGQAPGGRPVQHDVSIAKAPGDARDKGLRCEVKWLKSAKAIEVAIDIWKLALSRGSGPENSSLRTYLLIGGEADPFRDTLSTLRRCFLPLRRQEYGQRAPAPTLLHLERTLVASTMSTGRRALEQLLAWGAKPIHFRNPPAARVALRAFVRSWWKLRILGNPRWRAIMWELHAHGIPDRLDRQITWPSFPFTC